MAREGSLAEEVRTGLEDSRKGKVVELALVKTNPGINPLDELYFRKPVRQHVKEFACIISIILLIIAGVNIYLHSRFAPGLSLAGAAALLLVLGYAAPSILRPVWKGWMYFAEKLGAFVSLVLLTAAWAIAMVPVALITRLFQAKVMDLSFKADVLTYWEPRDPRNDDFKLLKRQF